MAWVLVCPGATTANHITVEALGGNPRSRYEAAAECIMERSLTFYLLLPVYSPNLLLSIILRRRTISAMKFFGVQDVG